MSSRVEYPNLHSRILMRSLFDRQFVMPEEPTGIISRVLKWYDTRVLKVDISGIDIDRPIFMIALPRRGARSFRT